MDKNNISDAFLSCLAPKQINWQAEHLKADIENIDLTDEQKATLYLRITGILQHIRQNPNIDTLAVSQIALDSITDQMQAEIHATSDHLTGLLNKAGIEKFAKVQFAMAQRHEKNIGVFFIDLNKFKPINDGLGHEEGDKALKLCASKIKNNVRREDIISRYGGDEFVIIMLNDKDHDWTTEYDKLKNLFENDVIYKSDEGEEYPIGASIGFVVAESKESPAQAIKRADVEMYKMKKGISGANADLGIEEEDIPLTIQIPLELHHQPE